MKLKNVVDDRGLLTTCIPISVKNIQLKRVWPSSQTIRTDKKKKTNEAQGSEERIK